MRRKTAQISGENFPNNMAYQILTWTLTPPQKDDGRIRVIQWLYLLIGQFPINQIDSKQDWVIKMVASLLPRELTMASYSSFGKTLHQNLLKCCLQARTLHSCGSGHQSWLVRRSFVTGTMEQIFYFLSIFFSVSQLIDSHFMRGKAMLTC